MENYNALSYNIMQAIMGLVQAKAVYVCVCQGGPCTRPPWGPWGLVVKVSGGRVHVRGLILHRLACVPPLNFGGCPCMSGVAVHVRQLPCTRPLEDLVARRNVVRLHFRSKCFLIIFNFGRRRVASRPLAESQIRGHLYGRKFDFAQLC